MKQDGEGEDVLAAEGIGEEDEEEEEEEELMVGRDLTQRKVDIDMDLEDLEMLIDTRYLQDLKFLECWRFLI